MAASAVIIDVRYRYFDDTVYFSIKSPVEIEQDTVEQCKTMTLDFIENSIISIPATSNRELILVDATTGKDKKIPPPYSTGVYLNNTNGMDTIVSADLASPCGVPHGAYYWRAIVYYDVRGVTKSFEWKTEIFNL